MSQADGVSTTPGHEWELNDPNHFLLGLVIFFPVAIDGQDVLGTLVNADDVWCQSVVIAKVMDDVALEHGAQTIDVVAVVLTTFDLVVCFLSLGFVRGQWVDHEVDVHVHA